MHALQPKHSKLRPEEVKELVEKYNLFLTQLPKIKSDDSCVPEGSQPGDVIKVERKFDDKLNVYYRVVA